MPLRVRGETPAAVAAWLMRTDEDTLLWINDRLVVTLADRQAVEMWYRLELVRGRAFALMPGAMLADGRYVEHHVLDPIPYAV